MTDQPMSYDSMKEAYELAEEENSNLRRILLWGAGFLNFEQRTLLRKKLNERPGGAVRDQDADDREEVLKRDKAIEALTDHVQWVIDSKENLEGDWVARADVLCNQLRAFIEEKKQLTFHELTEEPKKTRKGK